MMGKLPRFDEDGLPLYLDMQARLGHTKHIGGLHATRQLFELCQVSAEKRLLNVGCGAGATNLYLAETYGCHSTGVDLKQSMAAAARRWAERRRLAHLAEFRQASAVDLPFEDASFDIVISESVNVFVPDRPKAIAEYLRVVKPGGVVGLNEPVLLKPPSPAVEQLLANIVGHELFFAGFWEGLLHDAGLVEITARTGAVTMGEEARNQLAFFRKNDFLIVLGRMLKELFGDRYTRSIVKEATGGNPTEYFEYMGYGLFVGRKQLH